MRILKNLVALALLVTTAAFVAPRSAQADTAQMTLHGPTSFSYTVQFIQNGVVRWQNTNVTLPLGQRLISTSGLPAGSGYIAKAWVNGIGVQSNTWPPKTLSGTTHLGCLAFDISGNTTPWIGSCP